MTLHSFQQYIQLYRSEPLQILKIQLLMKIQLQNTMYACIWSHGFELLHWLKLKFKAKPL